MHSNTLDLTNIINEWSTVSKCVVNIMKKDVSGRGKYEISKTTLILRMGIVALHVPLLAVVKLFVDLK